MGSPGSTGVKMNPALKGPVSGTNIPPRGQDDDASIHAAHHSLGYAARYPATTARGQSTTTPLPLPGVVPIQGKESYVMRDGLRIYLWEKYQEDQLQTFSRTGRVVLLVHGGSRSGRSLYDLQIRDYSLMDFLARNGFDVWAIDIHGYGHSDKTSTDWIDAHSAAADIAAAVQHITDVRRIAKINLLGCSAGSQRTGVYVMEHPEKVARWVFCSGFWKGTADFREYNRKRIENGGHPLPKSRPTTEQDFRDGFVPGQFEEDVVRESVKDGLQMDPQRPNVFMEYKNLPILDPARITVPTLILHGEKDFAAKEEDLVPFFWQLATHDKSYVILPQGGHMILLEKG